MLPARPPLGGPEVVQDEPRGLERAVTAPAGRLRGKSAGLFPVTTDGSKPQLGAGADFEDADTDDTYDDASTILFDNAGFLGSFVQPTRASAGAQAQYAQDSGSVSQTAAAGMEESSRTVTQHR
ncbi:hypothetical protein GCM10010345_71430 [Streptomyces canarius]|uniref:Uncharacterized protein n=1 Tax=Streptomyces canarius TaxID=285453 RepID=A0ABQ3D3D4_9ACTN|nr:hypothetical protein GCM10010345_71430 [Streptomyces canarius]